MAISEARKLINKQAATMDARAESLEDDARTMALAIAARLSEANELRQKAADLRMTELVGEDRR